MLGLFTPPIIFKVTRGDVVLVSTGIGMVVGLASATLLTQGLDAPGAPAVALTPTALPGGAGLALAGRF
jgi:hypothetical protein